VSEPISEAILVHSAEYYPYTGDDAYGSPAYGTKVDLTKIRISRARSVYINSLGEAKEDKLILNFDCVNSRPTGTTFKHLDKIIYGGVSYLVRVSDDPSGDATAAHHYRVSLVGS